MTAPTHEVSAESAPIPPNLPTVRSGGGGGGHTARWIAIAIGVVALLFIVLLATRKSAESSQADSPLLGKAAPATAGPPMNSSTAALPGRVDLSSYQGKFVVVNFFASWCIPCQQEQPELVTFSQRHAAAGDAAVLGVVYDDQPDAVRRFLANHGGDWPVIDAPASKVDWGVRGVPESFLVAPDGVVLSHMVGGVTADGLDQLLRRAPGGAPGCCRAGCRGWPWPWCWSSPWRPAPPAPTGRPPSRATSARWRPRSNARPVK